MLPQNILYTSLDQSTTSTKFAVFNTEGIELVCITALHNQISTKTGWLSHDPSEILKNTLKVLNDGMDLVKVYIILFDICSILIKDKGMGIVKALGITNQRETTIAWNKNTGFYLISHVNN